RLQRIADQLKVPVETFFASSQGNDDQEAVVPAVSNDPKVVELVLAFTGIADETTRDSVLSIVKAAATIQRKRAGQA
ncbi:transcriptional regulator, partial [Methylobacterium sp. J-048]|nr:transcriptional regulator [Methylobacterium sp. J-048]